MFVALMGLFRRRRRRHCVERVETIQNHRARLSGTLSEQSYGLNALNALIVSFRNSRWQHRVGLAETSEIHPTRTSETSFELRCGPKRVSSRAGPRKFL